MRPTRTPRIAAPALLLCLILALPGCGSPGGAAATVIVDGSSTVFRISKAVQEAYADARPDVTVVVDNHGTGGGFSKYLQGEVDVVDASRDARPDEASQARAQGIGWTRFLVGYDGITVVVNPENTFVKDLGVEQLRAIWSPGSAVKKWRDVDPSWPDREIVLYSPDHDSGTFEFFTEAIVGKPRSQREDVQASSDDNTLVTGVAGDPGGLGYFGYAYFAANAGKLRAVPIRKAADAAAVMPSRETVLDKSYAPLSRPLYIFVKDSALRRPAVGDFVKYYLDNVAKFAEKGGYVAPTTADVAANIAAYESARRGAAAATESSGKTPAAGGVKK
jgi:phosphate transport system substrate-binding protein